MSILAHHNMQGVFSQTLKKWMEEVSSLPQSEPTMVNIADVLKQCQGAKVEKVELVYEDALVGSIPVVVELKKKLRVFHFFVEQHKQYIPKQFFIYNQAVYDP